MTRVPDQTTHDRMRTLLHAVMPSTCAELAHAATVVAGQSAEHGWTWGEIAEVLQMLGVTDSENSVRKTRQGLAEGREIRRQA